MLWKRVFVFAFCFCGSATGAHAQSSDATVVGTVREAVLASALPGATVEILKNGIVAASAESDENGRFSLPPLTPGEYVLRAIFPGYDTVEQNLELTARDALDVVLVLLPSTTVEERVEVTAVAPGIDPQRTGSSVNLTRERLESLPSSLTGDVPTLAQTTLPGAVLGHDNFVHVRGNELSLHQFVNGVSFLDNPHQHFFPGLSPQIFQNVNMVTGGFRAEFGNRFGGILDITTRSGASLGGRGTATASVGTIGNRSGSLEYGNANGRWGYYFFGGAFNSDRFLNPPEPQELHDNGHGGRGTFQLDYQGQRDLVKILVMGGASRFQLPNITAEQELGRDGHRELDSESVIASWRRALSSRSFLSAAFYQRNVWDHLYPTSDAFTTFVEASRSTLTVGGKVDWYYSRGVHRWKAGIDVAGLRLQENFDFDAREEDHEDSDHGEEDDHEGEKDHGEEADHDEEAGHDEEADHGHGGGFDELTFEGRRNGHIFGLYVQDTFNPSANLTLDLGVRVGQFNIVGSEAQVSPRVGAAYHFPDAGSVVRVSYNRLFTPPPIEYVLLASYVGNLPVEGEQPVGDVRAYQLNLFEVGLSQRLSDRVYIDVAAYHHSGENSFENSEIADTRLFVPTNFSKANAQGLEIEAELTPPNGMGVGGRIQYALAEVEFVGPVSGGFPGEVLAVGQTIPTAFDQRHTVVGEVTFRDPWRAFQLGTVVRFGSGNPIAEGEGHETFVYLPGHLTFDVMTRMDLWSSGEQQIGLEVDLTNLTDNIYQIAKESEITPIQYAPRRSVLGRVRWSF